MLGKVVQFFNWSSYNYTMDNPINMVDPDGRAPEDWIKYNLTGEYVWDENVTNKESTPEGYSYVGNDDDDIIRDLFGQTTFQSETEDFTTYNGDSGRGWAVTKYARIFTSLSLHINPIIERDNNGNKSFKGVDFLFSSSGSTNAPLLADEELSFQATDVTINGHDMEKVDYAKGQGSISASAGSELYKCKSSA